MSAALASRGLRRTNGDVIRLRFEDFGRTVPGGRFLDEGSGRSIWTASSSTVVYSATRQKEGGQTLLVTNTSDYLQTPYGVHNAITSGDFFVGLWVYDGAAASTYYLSVQGTTADQTDTAFGFVTNASNQMKVITSDGTTRTVWGGATACTASAFNYLSLERVGNTMYQGVNGTVVATQAITGSINLPSGRVIRIGKPEFGAGVGQSSYYSDMLQIRRASIYGGANFTPPTRALPA